MISNQTKPNQGNQYQREYDTNDGRTHVNEEGYT